MKEKEFKFCFLDININQDSEAFTLCKDFVAANNLKYGLTSDKVHELGGDEKKRLQDYFSIDYEWSSRSPGRIITSLPPQRITIKLYNSIAPITVTNFISLCLGDKGKGKSGKKLHYKGIIPGKFAQCGDFIKHNGTAGESIYGKKFKDEKMGLKFSFDRRGVIGMCNTGKNSNTSQFFVTFAAVKNLNGKHVVFGEIVDGWEVIDSIEECGSHASDGTPLVDVIIKNSGILPSS